MEHIATNMFALFGVSLNGGKNEIDKTDSRSILSTKQPGPLDLR